MADGRITVGTVNLGNLPKHWQILKELNREASRATDQYRVNMDFTDRRFDEATPTGRRIYFNAVHVLNVAEDNQLALEDMLLNRGIPPFAAWSLIRPAFENAFYAVWLLEPDDSRERCRRALRMDWQEQRAHSVRLKLKIELTHTEGTPAALQAEAADREIRHRYENEAHKVGLGLPMLRAKINLTAELPKLTSLPAGDSGEVPRFHLLQWRMISGTQHGDVGAVLNLSDAEYRLPVPGGQSATISVNDDSFIAACYSAAIMQWTALQLYIQRTTTHTGPSSR